MVISKSAEKVFDKISMHDKNVQQVTNRRELPLPEMRLPLKNLQQTP